MTKSDADKVKRLKVYVQHIKDRLDGAIPDKHKDHPNQFKAFLKNELRIAQNTIDTLLLESK
jgi:hypothetical protein